MHSPGSRLCPVFGHLAHDHERAPLTSAAIARRRCDDGGASCRLGSRVPVEDCAAALSAFSCGLNPRAPRDDSLTSAADSQFESATSCAAAAISAVNTSFLAAARRQRLSRRWSVRRSAVGKMPGCSFWRRRSSSVAVRSGSDSSHVRMRGHTSTKGSFRVRQSRRAFGSERCVGRTSPSCQAVARLFRNWSSSPSR